MSTGPLSFFTIDHGTASIAACLVAPCAGRFRLLASAVLPSGVDLEAVLDDLVRRVLRTEPGLLPSGRGWRDWPRLESATRPPRRAVCVARSESGLVDLERVVAGAGWELAGRVEGAHPEFVAATDLCLDPAIEAVIVSAAGDAGDDRAAEAVLTALLTGVASRRPELPLLLCGGSVTALEAVPGATQVLLPPVERVAAAAASALRAALEELPRPDGDGQDGLPDGRRGLLQAVATLAGLLDRRIEAVDVGHSASSRMLAHPSGVVGSIVSVDAALVPARAMREEREMEAIMRWSSLRSDPFSLADRIRNLRLAPWRDASGDGSRLRLAALRAALARLDHLWRGTPGEDEVLAAASSDLLVCSGGAFAAVPPPAAALAVIDAMRRPGAVTLFHDHARLLAPIGTLGDDGDRRRLLADLLDDALLPLGSAIVAGESRPGARHAATLRVTSRLQQHDLELAPGALRLVDLPPGVPARVELETREGSLLGVRARRLALDLTGGLGGLLVDTREVPLRLPDRAERRRALLEAWERPVWAAADL